jgi:hypothetical protein
MAQKANIRPIWSPCLHAMIASISLLPIRLFTNAFHALFTNYLFCAWGAAVAQQLHK